MKCCFKATISEDDEVDVSRPASHTIPRRMEALDKHIETSLCLENSDFYGPVKSTGEEKTRGKQPKQQRDVDAHDAMPRDAGGVQLHGIGLEKGHRIRGLQAGAGGEQRTEVLGVGGSFEVEEEGDDGSSGDRKYGALFVDTRQTGGRRGELGGRIPPKSGGERVGHGGQGEQEDCAVLGKASRGETWVRVDTAAEAMKSGNEEERARGSGAAAETTTALRRLGLYEVVSETLELKSVGMTRRLSLKQTASGQVQGETVCYLQ